MVAWKEREHELDDIHGLNDHGTINALQECGILNFFKVPNMRAHIRLLEYIVRMWNLEQKHFEVGAHILIVEVEYIYFLTGISMRGAPISMTGPRGGDVTTQDLIDQYCFPST